MYIFDLIGFKLRVLFIFGYSDMGMFGFLQKVAQTKEILSKQAVQTKEILSKQAVKIAKQAEEHERFINKVGIIPIYAKLI